MAKSATSKLLRRAYDMAAAGRIDDALSLLHESSASGDPDGALAEAAGFILFQRNRFAEAADAYAASLKANPENRACLHYLAQSLGMAGRWEEAQTRLMQASASHPHDAVPFASQCLLLLEKDEPAAARHAYNAARAIFRDHPDQTPYAMGLLEQCAEALTNPDPPPRRSA